MLPARNRISKQLLPAVLKQNKAFRADYLTLRLHLHHQGDLDWGKPAKLAVIINNKTLPRSVDRHLVKRRLHAILEPLWAKLGNNLDLIIQVTKNPLKLSFRELENEVLGLLKNI